MSDTRDQTTDAILLTADQKSAVHSEDRAIAIFAGAGSGKTEVVAQRVLRLLSNEYPAQGILALTYTNKAANELRSRLTERTGSLADRVRTSTIHSLAWDLVRQHGTKIGLPIEPELLRRDEDRAELFNLWRQSQGLPPVADPITELRSIDLARARREQNPAVDDWRAALASLPGLDYQGLLDAASEILALKSTQMQVARDYDHVIVDEAQNMSPAQYLILERVLGAPTTPGPSALLVGDDKQSIVGFAGADARLMHQFVDTYHARVVRLRQNFRSATVLSKFAARVSAEFGQETGSSDLHAARGLILKNESADDREEGMFVARWAESLLASGLPHSSLAEGERETLRAHDIAVLGRSAVSLRSVESALKDLGVDYSFSRSQSEWLEGRVGKIALELIALRAAPDHTSTHWELRRQLQSGENPIDLTHLASLLEQADAPIPRLRPLLDAETLDQFMQQLPLLAEGGGEDSDPELEAWAHDSAELSRAFSEFSLAFSKYDRTWVNFREFCSRQESTSDTSGVQLLTIHKAQGREFMAVAIVGLNEGQLPDFRATDVESKLAEFRAFYVAITRARRVLLLSRSKQRTTRYGQRVTQPSTFLNLANGEYVTS